MEQYHHSSPHYLIWSEFRSATMNPSFRPPPPPPFFQEWPPRSYSCSFCRREFRSAQALGGHMNVHRRDRAKLKQSPPTLKPSDHENPRRLISWGSENVVVGDDDFVENVDVLVCKRHKMCSTHEEIDLELRLGAPAVKVGQIS